jgi:hypothetical protein
MVDAPCGGLSMNTTRFVVLPDERGIILGKVIGDKTQSPLKPRMIYEISDVLGEILIKEVGEYALSNKEEVTSSFVSEGSSVTDQISEIGLLILTLQEFQQLLAEH